MNTLKAGDKAPLFKLADQNGDIVELAELLKESKVSEQNSLSIQC